MDGREAVNLVSRREVQMTRSKALSKPYRFFKSAIPASVERSVGLKAI